MLQASYGAAAPVSLIWSLDASALGAMPGASLTTSAAFNGSSQYLTVTNSAFVFDPAVSAGDFTVEGWFYPTSYTGVRTLFCLGTEAAGRFVVALDGGWLTTNFYGEFGSIQYSGDVPLNTWTHIAVVRSGTTIKVYIGGTADAVTETRADTIGNGALNLGADSNGTNLFEGYISNFRVGSTAVYTAGFTPPTTALGLVTGTILLLPLTGAPFTDVSRSDMIVTNTGSVATTASAPSLTAPTTDLLGSYGALTVTNNLSQIAWSSSQGGTLTKLSGGTSGNTQKISGGPSINSTTSYSVFFAYKMEPVSVSNGNGRILSVNNEATYGDWLLGSYAPGSPNTPQYINSFYNGTDMGYNVDAGDTAWHFIWATWKKGTTTPKKYIASATVYNTVGPTSAYKTGTSAGNGFNGFYLWNRSNTFEPACGRIGFIRVYDGELSLAQIQNQWAAQHARFGI
jgi:hypothetical protein